MLQSRITELRTLAATGKQGPKSAALVECLEEIERLQARKARAKFSLSDVMTEAERMGWAPGLAEECFDVYDAVGWVRGKNRIPIVRLPSAMRTWMRNRQKWNGHSPVNGKNGSEPPAGWADFVSQRYKTYVGTFKHAPEYMRLEFATWKKGKRQGAGGPSPNLL